MWSLFGKVIGSKRKRDEPPKREENGFSDINHDDHDRLVPSGKVFFPALMDIPSHEVSPGKTEERAKLMESSEIEKLTDTQFKCGICHDVICKALSLECGHMFCSPCITKWIKESKTCPTCRTEVTEALRPALAVDSFIDQLAESIGGSFKQRRIERIASIPPMKTIPTSRQMTQDCDESFPTAESPVDWDLEEVGFESEDSLEDSDFEVLSDTIDCIDGDDLSGEDLLEECECLDPDDDEEYDEVDMEVEII